jgi:hypothetical protein
VFNGRLLWQCNKWLRCALVEASWSAIQFSAYMRPKNRADNRNMVDDPANNPNQI